MSFADIAVAAFKTARGGPFGATITYRRGTDEVELTVLAGQSDGQMAGGDGFSTVFRTQDFTLLASELKPNGNTIVKPQRGDEIDWTDEGTKTTFVVNHPDPQQPPYRKADPAGRMLRVHAVQK